MTFDPELETIVMDALQGALAGGIVKTIISQIVSKLKSETISDENLIASLREVRQHCLALSDIITRILSGVAE